MRRWWWIQPRHCPRTFGGRHRSGVFDHAAGFTVRSNQTELRNHRSRIRSRIRFPVWITRCGVLTGAGQFGTAAQGIFAYWVNAHLRRRPLRYIQSNGMERAIERNYRRRRIPDARRLPPRDLASLLVAQTRTARPDGQRIYTAGAVPPMRCRSCNSMPGATGASALMLRRSIRSRGSTTSPGWRWTTPAPLGISTGI